MLSPLDVSTSAATIGINLILAVVAIVLIAFPSELFNSTLEENYAEVRGWFGPLGRATSRAADQFHRVPSWLGAIPFILVMAGLYGLLDPGFGLSRASLALFAGLVVGVLIITVVFDLPGIIQVRLAHGHSATVKTLPWTLAVAALCVLVSRLANFQPGYIYGLVAGLAVQGEITRRQQGRSLAVAAAGMFAISLVAWFAWLPIRSMATQPGASFWVLALDATLAVTFVCGLETMLFGLLPMRFLDGHKIYAWSRGVWMVLFGLGVFGVIQVLLTPKSGYVGRSIKGNEVVVIALLVGFAVASVAFWAYFRFRPAPTSASLPD
ncbi:MAG TPA: FGLLP motif-containing membrane protein [Candidatus Dormibacteraeota bacterium]|nr:FGLLP motif-containing membrane protein [Candidatus Dormibacteraeota bacterium]